MLKSCFGCCPLRQGVSGIAIFNLILIIFEIFAHVINRLAHYDRTTLRKMNSTVNVDEHFLNDDFNWDLKSPILSETFMDYILVTTLSWLVLMLISNICLKQSTFKQAPHKVYVWLIIYYVNGLILLLGMIHNIGYIFIKSYQLSNKENNTILQSMDTVMIHSHLNLGVFILTLIFIVISCFEIFIVQSYYILEKNAMLNNFVQLKWKYVSGGKIVSKGIDYPSASTFRAETLGQTQDGSRIPPFITTILQS